MRLVILIKLISADFLTIQNDRKIKIQNTLAKTRRQNLHLFTIQKKNPKFSNKNNQLHSWPDYCFVGDC